MRDKTVRTQRAFVKDPKQKKSPGSASGQLRPQSEKKRKSPADTTSREQQHSGPKFKRLRLILPANSESKPLSQAESPKFENSQAAQEAIHFGTLRSLEGPKLSIPLRAPYGLHCTEVAVGSDLSCGAVLSGDDVGKHHCTIILELWQTEHLQLRRCIRVKRIDLANPVNRILLWKGQDWHQLEESEILSDGDRVQFGHGPWFTYESPKLCDLYKSKTHLYGDDQTNSSVHQVKRLSDSLSFVAKAIDRKHAKMARRELDAFEILGYHPHITQLIEVFYDKLEGIHHLVLEASQSDLLEYVSRMGSHRQRPLIAQASQIIAQASSAVAHIHSHKMAHRDIKPENLLISLDELGNIKLKVCDFGLARLRPQPILTRWLAGTPEWMAPASFMTYPYDERLVDCYGVGRILYFLLSSSPWPEESKHRNVMCGCDKACTSVCAMRTLAFNTLMNAGMGSTCVNFLQNLLVGHPDGCMDIGELLMHPYLTKAISKLTT